MYESQYPSGDMSQIPKKIKIIIKNIKLKGGDSARLGKKAFATSLKLSVEYKGLSNIIVLGGKVFR